MHTGHALLTAVLLVAPMQAQAPTAPPPQTQPTPAPALDEATELKRQNLVLRSNLLQAQLEALRMRLERENADIVAAMTSLRATVENAHPGWTLNEQGAMAAKATTEKK